MTGTTSAPKVRKRMACNPDKQEGQHTHLRGSHKGYRGFCADYTGSKPAADEPRVLRWTIAGNALRIFPTILGRLYRVQDSDTQHICRTCPHSSATSYRRFCVFFGRPASRGSRAHKTQPCSVSAVWICFCEFHNRGFSKLGRYLFGGLYSQS